MAAIKRNCVRRPMSIEPTSEAAAAGWRPALTARAGDSTIASHESELA